VDAAALRLDLEALHRQLVAGEDVEVTEVEEAVAQVRSAVVGASRADVEALKCTVDKLTALVIEIMASLDQALDEVGRGRRGNKGYLSLRANRKSQRLYRRA
jgi:hypothetical protein